MTAGRFILSFDCEGKWGVADHLDARIHAALTDRALRATYTRMLALLDEFHVAATLACTSLFLLSRDEQLSLPRDDIAARLPYTRAAFDDVTHGTREGWSAPWLRELAPPRHEIALHGVTHSPWGSLSREQARYEMSLVRHEPGLTFVYPRNEAAHTDVLLEHGIVGYRAGTSKRMPIVSLASEFGVLARSQPDAAGDEAPRVIPGGYFINWLSGARTVVPTSVTRLRMRHVLRDAARTGGVAHFWSHPENLATAPSTFDNLRALLEEVDRLRQRGELTVETQRDYCAALEAARFSVGST